MSASAWIKSKLLQSDLPTGFADARLLETRLLGQAAAIIAIPALLFFIWFDLVQLGIREFLPARLASLGLFVISGLILTLRPQGARLVYFAHGSALLGLVSMNCYMVFATLKFYPDVDMHVAMSTSTLSVILFMAFIFSGGLRLVLPLIAGIPILVLSLNLCLSQPPGACTFEALVNPWLILLIILVLGFAQERSKRREMESLNLSHLRAKQLDALLNATTEAACMIDETGRVVLCNQAMADMLKKPMENLTGASLYDLVAPDLVERQRGLVSSVLDTERANRSEELRNGNWFDQVIYPVREDSGPIRFLAIYSKDISALKSREEKLVFQASHDPLTGLANRRLMHSRLKQAINRARRSYPSSLLLIDLDHFKEINDRYGHDAGDKVLVAIAKILLEGRRDYDSVFRIGGDEFAILVDGATIAEACVVAERIRAAVSSREFEDLGNNDGKLSLSIGGVTVDPTLSGDEIIKLADEAMYRAKQAGRNRVEMVDFGAARQS